MVGFIVVGVPSLLAGILIFIFSFFPYIGTAFVWLPIGIYLIIIGKVWQGIFILLWGALVISLIDNMLRPYLIKGKAQVHPMIIFFSIFGGLALMGIWGIIFGPLIVSLAVTILHIYELEYGQVLDR
jgi:predicted PurR-regulated permease PerM